MPEPDWQSTELDHKLVVEMADAIQHSDTLGVLSVDEGSANLTMDITTNTISQASISCPDWREWIENSWIRIVHEVPSAGYRKLLGTFFVYNEGVGWNYNSYSASPTLYSSLKALSLDKLASPIFIGKGAPVSKVVAAILAPFIRYTISPECGEYYYTSTYVLDAGESKMDALQTILGHVNWEYKLEGDGSVTFIPFTPYASRAIAYTIDAQSKHSVIHENTLKPEGSDRSAPGRSIVVWKGDGSDDEPTTAYADVDHSDPASPQRRGYVIAEVHELSDMQSDRTPSNALVYARSFLSRDSRSMRKWSMSTYWLPIEAGDCVMFRPPDDDSYIRAIVQNIEYDLSKWKLKITIAEV